MADSPHANAALQDPSAVSQSPHVAKRPAPKLAASAADRGATLVVDMRGDVAAEFAEYAAASCLDANSFVQASLSELPRFRRLVLFLPKRGDRLNSRVLDQCAAAVKNNPGADICVISSFRVHFGDADLLAAEQSIIQRLQNATTAHVTILRPGHILSSGSRIETNLCRFASLHRVVPHRLRSCFLDAQELFAIIDDVTSGDHGHRPRVMTVLGPNRALRDVLAERASPGRLSQPVTFIAQLLAWLFIGQLVGLVLRIAAWFHRPWRRWQFDTLSPASTSELVSLYNPYSYQTIAIAGYNTGVVHFGWTHPGKTTVKTVGAGHVVKLRGDSVVVDAGVTLKRTVEELRRVSRELCVVPNYSYISMGTTFFVPVHGSASEVSTLGETIEKVWLYDPRTDRVMVLRRNDPRFADAMYNASSGLLALRLQLRVQQKRRFTVERTQLESPTASDVWHLFADGDAANIELRKSRAQATEVDVSKYYLATSNDEDALNVAQDTVGRLWDRLEENAITSYLFHTLVRRWGFHVELFLDKQEFEVFWNAHTSLPLSKIQLRFVRGDGLPHSPSGNRDCISADLFMSKANRAAFVNFINEQLPHARFNPGKHSA